jgi:hypothetical protein
MWIEPNQFCDLRSFLFLAFKVCVLVSRRLVEFAAEQRLTAAGEVERSGTEPLAASCERSETL